eukprot:TRINITY_DN23481_c0_g1_i1.p1 TRINITY_DN23481_c0_g1~~TRINITY_DN23481_c0_g1_i1.p1  ORF type:complete len:358 (+),score=108.73 TRINITY_DN23481_c0_g1_i1:245-1318(+)
MLPDEFTGNNYTKIIVYSAVGVGGCLLVVLLLGFALHYLSIQGLLESFFEFVASLGLWGYFIMGFVMAILNLPFTFAYLPTATLCGFMYGFWWGLLVVSVGSGVGMAGVFLMFRYWMRKSAAKFIEKKGGYMGRALLYELKQSSPAEHVKLVILIRIAAPFPPGLQNAVLAVSGIQLWLYQLVSMLSMLVKQVPAVYIGSTVKDISEITSSGSSWELKDYLLVVIGAVGILLICVVVFVFTKKTIERAKQLREEDKIQEENSMISDEEEEAEPAEVVYNYKTMPVSSPALVGDPLDESEDTFLARPDASKALEASEHAKREAMEEVSEALEDTPVAINTEPGQELPLGDIPPVSDDE